MPRHLRLSLAPTEFGAPFTVRVRVAGRAVLSGEGAQAWEGEIPHRRVRITVEVRGAAESDYVTAFTLDRALSTRVTRQLVEGHDVWDTEV
jgi:hypothetical protein